MTIKRVAIVSGLPSQSTLKRMFAASSVENDGCAHCLGSVDWRKPGAHVRPQNTIPQFRGGKKR